MLKPADPFQSAQLDVLAQLVHEKGGWTSVEGKKSGPFYKAFRRCRRGASMHLDRVSELLRLLGVPPALYLQRTLQQLAPDSATSLQLSRLFRTARLVHSTTSIPVRKLIARARYLHGILPSVTVEFHAYPEGVYTLDKLSTTASSPTSATGRSRRAVEIADAQIQESASPADLSRQIQEWAWYVATHASILYRSSAKLGEPLSTDASLLLEAADQLLPSRSLPSADLRVRASYLLKEMDPESHLSTAITMVRSARATLHLFLDAHQQSDQDEPRDPTFFHYWYLCRAYWEEASYLWYNADLQGSIRAIRAALRYARDDQRSLLRDAEIAVLERLGRTEEAAALRDEQSQDGTQYTPRQRFKLSWLAAQNSVSRGKVEEAAARYRELLASDRYFDPLDPILLYLELADLLLQLGQHDDVQRLAKVALSRWLPKLDATKVSLKAVQKYLHLLSSAEPAEPLRWAQQLSRRRSIS